MAHFIGANETAYFASLLMPPEWRYVPANRSTSCGTAVCYAASSDTLRGPDDATIAMGAPTAMGSQDTCATYARAQTGAGYVLSGQKSIDISSIEPRHGVLPRHGRRSVLSDVDLNGVGLLARSAGVDGDARGHVSRLVGLQREVVRSRLSRLQAGRQIVELR